MDCLDCLCCYSYQSAAPQESQAHTAAKPPLFREPRSDQNGVYYLYKVVIVGDSDTGKSCLLYRFIDDRFFASYIATIGLDFRIRTIVLDGVRTKLHLYDTSGQPRFRTIGTSYFREATGMIIAYSATQEDTFNSVPYWLEEIKRYAHPDVKLMLVATKCDGTGRKVVEYTRAKDFASEKQIPFFEVSNKDGTNVELAFINFIAQLRQLQIAPST